MVVRTAAPTAARMVEQTEALMVEPTPGRAGSADLSFAQ
jgi:hypothetical protein